MMLKIIFLTFLSFAYSCPHTPPPTTTTTTTLSTTTTTLTTTTATTTTVYDGLANFQGILFLRLFAFSSKKPSKALFRVWYQFWFRPKQKLRISVFIGISQNEKKPFGHTLALF